ncbi:MAG TPA: hypothetical protein VGW38_26010 [Chloroflexota bacterium]|nr:hypothetical protein [Chloroflexota bacterium]
MTSRIAENVRVIDMRSVPMASAVPVGQVRVQDVALRQEPAEQSRLASWFGTATLGVVIWSVSYLLRQPGVAAMDAPFSFLGNFALEGMVLALGWLGLMLAGCLAIVSGVAMVHDPSSE